MGTLIATLSETVKQMAAIGCTMKTQKLDRLVLSSNAYRIEGRARRFSALFSEIIKILSLRSQINRILQVCREF